MAVDAVHELHGLADVVHVGGHAHKGEAGRAKERLGVLECAARQHTQGAAHRQRGGLHAQTAPRQSALRSNSPEHVAGGFAKYGLGKILDRLEPVKNSLPDAFHHRLTGSNNPLRTQATWRREAGARGSGSGEGNGSAAGSSMTQ